MHLREGEQVLQVYHHHPTPFVYDILKVILGSLPFLFMLFLFKSVMSTGLFVVLNLAVLFVFVLVLIYVSLIYWLDKLVITNRRLVHIDWKYLTVRNESELDLREITDIQTYEKGFLAHFWIFDYGTLKLDTASSYVALEFFDAPNPEAIRRYIFHLKHQ